MDETQIETSKFWAKNYIKLFSNRIVIRKSTPFESSEFEVSYEQMENKKSIETKVNFGMLIVTSIGVIIGFLYLFGNHPEIGFLFLFIAVVVLLISFATKTKVVIIKTNDGRNIELYFNDQTKDKVISFSNTIINSSNTFLLNKYSKIDRDLPIDSQMQNLIFLRDRELLSEEKFEQLKNQLLGKDNKSIGYR